MRVRVEVRDRVRVRVRVRVRDRVRVRVRGLVLGPNLRDGLPPELRDHLDDEVVELDEIRARLPLRAVHLWVRYR